MLTTSMMHLNVSKYVKDIREKEIIQKYDKQHC